MDPVPYEIREDDVDEVLSAWESTGGGDFDDDTRREARQHVMRNITEVNDIVRTAPADRRVRGRDLDADGSGTAPREDSTDRRDLALAAIEDLLIRDGFIETDGSEPRVFPAGGE
jgi:hypothetical protein